MQLLLLRHGNAENRGADGRDFSRHLTEKGVSQARNVARILKAADMLPDLVLSSPLTRAVQTADTFTAAAGLPGSIMQSWLSCGMTPETALSELSAFPDFERVMIVGHEPDISRLVQYCLGATGNCIEIRKGSVTCLEISPPSRSGYLSFLLPHKLGKHVE